MERILIKRTERETLSFYPIQLKDYNTCFLKFFADKENLKYNNFEKVEIVDKNVAKMYIKWEDKHIFKK